MNLNIIEKVIQYNLKSYNLYTHLIILEAMCIGLM